MITVSPPEATAEIVLSRGGYEFAQADLEMVARGIAGEDMVPVTPEELKTSYACVGSYVMNGVDREMVAFARMLKREYISVDDQNVVVTEIGSFWTNPNYRGRGHGESLLRSTTEVMTFVGFLPVAVCNQDSRRVFERVGYEPVAAMNNHGMPRVIEVYPHGIATGPSIEARHAAITRLNELDRFRHMDLLV